MAVSTTWNAGGAAPGKEFAISARAMWLLFWAAAGSFLPHLFLQYMGEEAVYPIAAQEMHASGDLIHATAYGLPMGRPGLFVWLIVALADLLGQNNVLIAARLIAIASTVGIALTLAWLVRRLFHDRVFAALAAAIFLSGDVLFNRGWLGYVDPLFSLLTFGAMSCLWVALEERRRSLLLLAAICLSGSFLGKAITGYVFYGVLGLILLWRHPNRSFLFTPLSVLFHAAALAFPFVWDYAIAHNAVLWAMVDQTAFNATNTRPPGAQEFAESLVLFPIQTLVYLLPTSAIVIFALLSRRIGRATFQQNAVLIALFAAALNLLPYWMTAAAKPRYLLPVFPFFALVMAFAVLNAGAAIADLCKKALIGTVALAYAAALVGFPLYEHFFRGSYDNAAQAIIARAGRFPIFVADVTSIGISIVADINARRPQTPPVSRPPDEFASGLVIAAHPDAALGKVDATFSVGPDPDGSQTRYLLCRGEACSADGTTVSHMAF
jgi:4-amino-4-deoxy-L-arabinose transferase-like glycosyltransferase